MQWGLTGLAEDALWKGLRPSLNNCHCQAIHLHILLKSNVLDCNLALMNVFCMTL